MGRLNIKHILWFVMPLVFAGVILALGGIEMLFWLLIAGIVPGTDIVVPPLLMLTGYTALALCILFFAIRKELYPGSPTIKKAHREANKKAVKSLNQKLALERRRAIRARAQLSARRNSQRPSYVKRPASY